MHRYREHQISDAEVDQISELVARITRWNRRPVGWVIIAANMDALRTADPEDNNLRIYANTGEPRQVMALMHTALFGMTARDLR